MNNLSRLSRRLIISFGLIYLGIGFSSCSNKGSSAEKEHISAKVEEVPSSVDVHKLQELLETSSGVQLIDVRTAEEINQGVISADAYQANVLADDFENRIQDLDKTQIYYVYCKAGGRSKQAQTQMEELGFTRVVNIDGGITAWQEAGYPLDRLN